MILADIASETYLAVRVTPIQVKDCIGEGEIVIHPAPNEWEAVEERMKFNERRIEYRSARFGIARKHPTKSLAPASVFDNDLMI